MAPTREPIQKRGGFVAYDERLGRIPSYDERSRGWQVRTLLDKVRDIDCENGAEIVPAPTEVENAPQPVPFDQSDPPCPGPYGADGCVGASFGTALNATPIPRAPQWKHTIDHSECCWLYRTAQTEDEWAGEAYGGTSLIAALRIAHRFGIISEYRWIGAGSQTPIDDLVDTFRLLRSGVWFGIPIYWSMMDPGPSGLLEVDPASGLAGYHAIYGVDLVADPPGLPPGEYVVWQNTWGPDWGTTFRDAPGCCYVPVPAIETDLLPRAVYGEAAVIIENEHGPGA
jgi:hypothetical protein